jgi:hypothetical protein
MKKNGFFVGMLGIVLAFGLMLTGCGEKGGTVTIRNSTGEEKPFSAFSKAVYDAGDEAAAAAAAKTIANGATASWSFDEDGDYYTISWQGFEEPRKVTLSGGDSKEVEYTE